MDTAYIDIPTSKGYLIPIGDLHRGDQSLSPSGLAKLKGYLDWCMEREHAYIFLMGDILNTASRVSATNPFESMSGDDEYEASVKLFAPYRERIVGAITGNHEQRMSHMFGFNPLKPFCRELDIPYMGYSAALRVRVGVREDRPTEYHQVYWGYAHHGTGGSGSLGGALNRKVKLQEIMQGVDWYMAGHDHQLAVGTRNILLPKRDKIVHLRQHFIDTGSFLDWKESYAEEKMFPISKQGAPRLRFSGERGNHDLHVSI